MDVTDIMSLVSGYIVTYGIKFIIAIAIFVIGKWLVGIVTNFLVKALDKKALVLRCQYL